MVIIFLAVLAGTWALCWAAKNFFPELKLVATSVVYIESLAVIAGAIRRTEYFESFYNKKDENND